MSEVDSEGQVLSKFMDVYWPHHLALDSEGHVLVADWNHRILQLSSELELQNVLIDTDSPVQLRFLRKLCYNERT